MIHSRLWQPSLLVPPEFVLDVSVALAWLLSRLSTEYTDKVMTSVGSGVGIVPGTWALELGDLLLRAERKKRVSHADVDRFFNYVRTYRILIDDETSSRAWGDVHDLARLRRITVHKAAYIELALRRKLPLATIDATLIRAATAAGVAIFTP